MAFPPDDSWFRRIIEEQRQLEKLLNPFPNEMFQNRSFLKDMHSPLLDYKEKFLGQANINDYLSIAGISNDFMSVHEEIQNSLGSVSALNREMEHIGSSTMFGSILSAQEEIYRLQDQFAQNMSFNELPSTRIESVLAAAEATSRLYQPQGIFSEFTLSSVAEYQSFIDKQLKQTQYDNEIIADRRFQVSELSGGLFEMINASLDIGVALERQTDYQGETFVDDEIINFGLYGQVNQHLGYVYSNRYSGDIEESFNKTNPTKISRLGFSITEQIHKINSICENSGKSYIFKPTSRTMRACAIIPSLVARTEIDFHHLIDQLFFLLYEGSGTANRLIPILSKSHLEPLWKLKNLRLFARHDIDHGSKREVEKKRNKINETYTSLIKKPLPLKQSDWQKAQLQMYVEIDFMLNEIVQKILNN